MWLIDVRTFELKNFFGRNVAREHPYAILSHTWEEDEVTFQDMQYLERARAKKGFWKIEQTCQQAGIDTLDYAWVDTCCIDKSSSSELQEAINSMFEWYARASICYAFLSDVQESDDFTSSRWFTRGWTLQELIAPGYVSFYGPHWHKICTRSRERRAISYRTGIPISMLVDTPITRRSASGIERKLQSTSPTSSSLSRYLGDYSIAMRMSWASQRETSRIEDRAYSLMGIFGVSMPLLYGEGGQSFVRLQEEILRKDTDLSILTWEPLMQTEPDEDDEFSYKQSLFAPSPRHFTSCGDIFFHATSDGDGSSAERTVTAVGLRATLPVIPLYVNDHEMADYAAVLSCYRETDVTSTIVLKLTSQHSAGMLMSGIEFRDSEALPMLPYWKELMEGRGLKRRTMELDVFQVEGGGAGTLRPVIILRQEPSTMMIRSVELHDIFARVDDTPSYIWFRFSAAKLPGASWEITHFYPKSEWDVKALTFRVTGAAKNHADGPAPEGIIPYSTQFIVGSIALRRHDVARSKVVISFACPVFILDLDEVQRYGAEVARRLHPGKEPRKIFFRVETIWHGQQITHARDLLSYCDKLMREDIPIDNAAFRQGRDLMSAKAVHLYEGTALYETAIFAVKPEFRQIAGRWTVVLHAFDLTDMAQLKQLDEPSDVPICQRVEPPRL